MDLSLQERQWEIEERIRLTQESRNKRSFETVGRGEVQRVRKVEFGKLTRKVSTEQCFTALVLEQKINFYERKYEEPSLAIGWQLTASLRKPIAKPMAEPTTRSISTVRELRHSRSVDSCEE